MTRLPVLLLLLACGCARLVVPATTVEALALNADMGADAYAAWQREAVKRWGEVPIVVSVHGGSNDGRWTFTPDTPQGEPLDVRTLAWTLRYIYGDRKLLLLICNEGQYDIDTPGTFYAKRRVFTIPGDDERTDYKGETITGCGSISEFGTATTRGSE